MLTLDYTLTEKEFLDYNYYTSWQGPEKKKHRLKYYVTGLFAYAALTSVLFYEDVYINIQTTKIVMIVISLIILFLLIRYRMRSVFDKQAKKMIEESGPKKVLAKTILTLNENGIIGKTDVAEVKYSWNAFQKKVFTNNCYYLYTNTRQALVIPQSAFQTPEEKKDFDKILLAHFPLHAELNSLKQ